MAESQGGGAVRVRSGYLLRVAAIAAVYYVSAKLGFTLAFVAEQVTTVWPPTGISLAAVLMLGYRVWPGVLIGALLANLTTNEPLPVAAAIAAGNTLEALAGAWLLRRLVGFDHALERIRDVLALVVLAAAVSTAVSATVGAVALCLSRIQPWSAFGAIWRDWWLGDAMGDLLAAPALLTWATWRRGRWPAGRRLEAAAALACLLLVVSAVFAGGVTAAAHHPLEYTIFPLLIGAALRFGQPGTALAILLASTVAISGTVAGYGPFAGGTTHESLVLLQVFNGVMATTALLLGAAMAERATRERRREADYAVTQVLAEALTLAEAAPGILKAVCESLGWDVGILWTVDAPAQRLRCIAAWHMAPAQTARFEDGSRGLVFGPGVGLPGRVWSAARPYGVEDVVVDANFPRAAVALEVGLHGAVGFPILLREEVVGVIEFFSRDIRRPDKDLVQMFATVGGQVGQFMDREQSAEARARLLESEKAARAHAEGLAADLRRANRAKDEFLAVLGHELRNPLAPLRNALEVLRMRGATDPQTARMHEIMARQVKHLARLVDDLLDVSRITRGRVELRRETTEVATLVAGAAEGLRTLFEERRHRLEITLPESPVILDVDPLRVEQVLANLLANAAKYTPPGGAISLSVEQEAGDAVVRVKDNGIGIPAEMIERVFDLFAQADRLPDTIHQGLGIGLTLVRRLVELHDGRVVARSAGRGQGSEFEVRLPLSAASSERPAAMAPAPRQRARRILVVDDNEDAAESLAVVLRLSGHDVRTARDGPSALESARASAPEVILLDIGLPGMSGYDVARELRSGKRGRPLVIALTGYGQTEDRRRAQEAGFDLHFVKPLDLARFERALSALDRESA
jgi:signal transduction histidine kinase/integral membrane sensor domain MASE1/ActR/RegA family two-component response regulator